MGILSEIDMMNRDAEDDAFEVSSDSETVDSFSEEFDAAEAKRKAEWEAKQAHKNCGNSRNWTALPLCRMTT